MRAVFCLLSLSVAAVAACASEPERVGSSEAAAADELPVTIDTATLVRELSRRNVRSKSEALALLPRAFKERFVLMSESGALGVASRARPRVIHFAEDGRLIIASTGHSIEEDVTARSLEILAEDPTTKTYRTHTIEIDPVTGPRLIEDDARCTGCHGTPARPIWGSYPTWPGAYGGQDDQMTPDEKADFSAFVRTARNDPDYRHLAIHETDWGFYLPTPYGHPNTLFGKVLGRRFGAQLAARMAASPLLPQLEYALAGHTFDCRSSTAVTTWIDRLYTARFAADPVAAKYPAIVETTKIYRLLGVEPAVDMQLAVPTSSPPPGDHDVGYDPWNSGSNYLYDLIELPLFASLVARDAFLADTYGPQRSVLENSARLMVEADSAELQSHTDSDAYYNAMLPQVYRYVHAPVADQPGVKAEICRHLDERQLARQRP